MLDHWPADEVNYVSIVYSMSQESFLQVHCTIEEARARNKQRPPTRKVYASVLWPICAMRADFGLFSVVHV